MEEACRVWIFDAPPGLHAGEAMAELAGRAASWFRCRAGDLLAARGGARADAVYAVLEGGAVAPVPQNELGYGAVPAAAAAAVEDPQRFYAPAAVRNVGVREVELAPARHEAAVGGWGPRGPPAEALAVLDCEGWAVFAAVGAEWVLLDDYRAE